MTLLKDSGLVTLLGPVAHGGGGQDWTTALRVIRAVSAGDGSIGQLLGYHYLWARAARLVGTTEQIEAVEQAATAQQWFYGGAVNPRDSDLTIRVEGDELVFSGQKSFSTGGRVSDVTVLEGVIDGTENHVFAIVPTDQPAIRFHGDWDNLGQRLTESGGVTIDGVRVPWESAAGYVNGPDGWAFVPRTYNTLNVPLIQLIFANLYLGIARGALATAATYTRERTRPPALHARCQAARGGRVPRPGRPMATCSRGSGRQRPGRAGRGRDRGHQRARRHRHAPRTRPGRRDHRRRQTGRDRHRSRGRHSDLRRDRCARDGLVRRPRHLLAQHPHPQPARPDRAQARRGRPSSPCSGRSPSPPRYT
ncbi:hypothetical protein LP418_06285 [Nocardioides sp. B-3]|nr:hypothetical protein [Nocardioides sp. B-3]UUZ60486.1 hypothetical protein LP418_06285 [Nocardioides sp. B-3]